MLSSQRPRQMDQQVFTYLNRSWHAMTVEETTRALEVDPEHGLSAAEVTARRERFGFNILTERRGRGHLVRFLLQFHQPLVYILLLAGLITVSLKEIVDATVIFGVILVNAIIGFIQETKAITAIAALAKRLVNEAIVIREGQKQRLPAAELIPGDLVLLQSGDKVPADLRLLRVRDLQIDESALTGESIPVQKHARSIPDDAVIGDRDNMAYASMLVTYGTGTGLVVATGDRTEIGRISEMIATTEVLETPLTRKIARFSHILLYVIISLAGLIFIAGMVRGNPLIDNFMAAVALTVSAIPEGLPAAVTITLAIGVSRMARRHAIIRSLPAVETLGSTTVICSDKTGTLTQNQMTVQQILAGGQLYEVTGSGYIPQGAILRVGDSETAQPPSMAAYECLRAGMLCNDSVLIQADGSWKIQGDPTEGALLVSAWKGGIRPHDVAALTRLDAIPFESERQYMATLHNGIDGAAPTAYLKGSLESLLSRCTEAYGPDGQAMELKRGEVERQAALMAAEGLRVLAFARKELPSGTRHLEHADLAGGLTFLGLQAMIDPPRPEAARAVVACHRAGIRVKMITGDHAVTAGVIANRLGITNAFGADDHPPVLTGRELDSIDDQALLDVAERTAVFARVSPEHKLRLVRALQARRHVIAMTGDGVNDGPALRRADIGIAMGQSGTDVAREASDMVLTDDNFASIETAVEEGRAIFDNLLKFIIWTLPTNGGESLVLLLAVLFGVALPVLPVQILWINMTTAVCLGLMLAFEPKEPGIMNRPPRSPDVPLLTPILGLRILLVSALLCAGAFSLYELQIHHGFSQAEARTAVVAVFVVGETFYLFNCRSLMRSVFSIGLFSNLWLWGGIAVMMTLQILFTYLPVMNRLFHTEPMSGTAWGWVLLIGAMIHLAVGIEKWFWRRRSSNRQSD